MASISLAPLLAAAMIAPGYIIAFVSSRFTTGRPSFSGGIAITSVYYISAWALLGKYLDIGTPEKLIEQIKNINHLWSIIIIVAVPTIVGGFVGLITQRGWHRKALNKLPLLRTINPIQSSWDVRFLRMEERWVRIYLSDDSEIFAKIEKGCFISSDPKERDIYLNNVDTWTKGCRKINVKNIEGVLIKGDHIRIIKFYSPEQNKGGNDEQEKIEAS